MAFNQSLIYFDLPVCPATQVGLVLLYQLKACNNSIKVTKRACMARGRTPEEVWMRTPDEVEFYTPYTLFMKREGVSEGFCSPKGQKWRGPEVCAF
jgi:hypothetical protein